MTPHDQALPAHDPARQLADRIVAALGIAMLAAGIAMLAGLYVVFAWAMSLCITLTSSLGIARRGQLGPFKPWLLAALLVWIVAFGAMAQLPGDTARLVGGVPPATAVALYVLWPAPFLLVTLPYALLFRRHVLPEPDSGPRESGSRQPEAGNVGGAG